MVVLMQKDRRCQLIALVSKSKREKFFLSFVHASTSLIPLVPFFKEFVGIRTEK